MKLVLGAVRKIATNEEAAMVSSNARGDQDKY